MATTTIGLKLGSNMSWIYTENGGMVLCEPTMIAISNNIKSKEVKAVGYDAKNMIGKVPENVSLFSPIANGVVQYEELVASLIKEFLNKVFVVKKFNQKIKALLFIPECLNYQEKKQFEVCCYKAGINEVVLIPEVLCYDLGNSDTSKAHTKVYVDIGHDQTNISILFNNSIVNAYSLSVGSSIINIAIKKYIEDKYFIRVGTNQANYIRKEIGSLFENYNVSLNIAGLNTKLQQRQQIVISSNELYPILSYYYGKIAESIKSIMLSSDPVIVSDAMSKGINVYGGGSDVAGFELFILKTIGYFTNNIKDSDFETNGVKKLIKSPLLLKNILK